MWKLLFALFLPYAFIKAAKEPIFACMWAVYFYYVHPQWGFGFPDGPWAVLFWFIVLGSAARYGGMIVEWTKNDVRESIDKATGGVFAETIPILSDAVYTAAIGGQRELVDLGLASIEGKADPLIALKAPSALQDLVKETVAAGHRAAASTAEKEALRVLDAGMTGLDAEGQKKSLNTRVTPFIESKMKEVLDEFLDRKLDQLLEKSAEDQDAPTAVPLWTSPFKALFTNAGMILFILWIGEHYLQLMFLTVPRPYAIEGKIALTRLLLIPMAGIILAVRTDRHFRMFTLAWVIGVANLSARAGKLWVTYGGRIDDVGGQGGEANFLGAIIVVVAPIAFSMLFFEEEKLYKRGGMVLAGIFVLGILACGSRGAMLALILELGYWLLYTAKKGKAWAFAMAGVFAFLAVCPPEFIDRMSTIFAPKSAGFGPVKEEESKHERKLLWAVAKDLMVENPVLGVGANNYPAYSAVRLPQLTGAYSGQPGLMTHNSWLQIGSEYGAVGMFLWAGGFFFSWFSYRKARQLLKNYPSHKWFAGLCLGFEAGTLGSALGITFSSFQWLDYIYWHLVSGPLAYGIAVDIKKRLDFFMTKERRAELIEMGIELSDEEDEAGPGVGSPPGRGPAGGNMPPRPGGVPQPGGLGQPGGAMGAQPMGGQPPAGQQDQWS